MAIGDERTLELERSDSVKVKRDGSVRDEEDEDNDDTQIQVASVV